MHLNILSDSQQKLIELVSEFGNNFYLVGGTALALQFGHRCSIDFDLFSLSSFNGDEIKNRVGKSWEINQVYVSSKDELTMMVQGVKMTWYRYQFDILSNIKWLEVINMPNPLHIAAMKAYALGHRAKWKDYVDLYFLFKRYSLEEVVALTTKIFGNELFDERLLREQLVYYDDVDFSEKIEFMPGFEVGEGKIKDFLVKVATA